MKIGILGLRPRQIADVAHRKFNGHQLSFFDEKTCTRENIASFCRKVDRVIVVVNGMPKTAIDWVPYANRHTMTGSVSTVLNYINSLPHDEPGMIRGLQSKTDKVQTKVETSEEPPARDEEELEAPLAVLPPSKLASIVPSGYESQYRWPPNAVLIDGDALPMRKRFEMLDAAQPGDVVRYARPADTALPVWRNRIGMLRHNRLKKNQLIEAHFYSEYVDLLIMSQTVVIDAAAAHKEKLSQGTVESEAAAVGMDDVLKTSGAGLDIQDGGAAMADAIPMVDVPIPSDLAEPAQKESPATVDPSIVATPAHTQSVPLHDLPEGPYPPTERGFWRQAYLAALTSNRPSATAAIVADEAVKAFRLRFTPHK